MLRMINIKSVKQFFLLNQKVIKLVLELFLVCVFAWIEWRFKYRFYPVFIVCIFIVALLFQNRRNFDFIIAIIMVFFILNTTTPNNLSQIKELSGQFIQNPEEGLFQAFTPNTGLEVLPRPVQNMLIMINENSINSYRLSPKFLENKELEQRIVESAWPIKLEETSPFIFITTDESDQYQNCTIIDDSEDLTLVDCH